MERKRSDGKRGRRRERGKKKEIKTCGVTCKIETKLPPLWYTSRITRALPRVTHVFVKTKNDDCF